VQRSKKRNFGVIGIVEVVINMLKSKIKDWISNQKLPDNIKEILVAYIDTIVNVVTDKRLDPFYPYRKG